MTTQLVKRFDERDRLNHWAIALLFFAAGLSGLAFFHPALYFLSTFFGGGPWTRILHPFLGVLMAVAFARFALAHRGDNRITDADREWKAQMGRLIAGDDANMPPAGKFNYGQKMLFWAMVVCMVVLVLTGFVFWRPWFAPYFPIGLIRIATLLHAVAATGIVLLVIGHIYMAIWTQGSIRGMTRGTVTAAWARQNHALWYRDVTGGK
ncbi:MAG: formate dehydrogenase subunit gamma [Burkholderiales bacterium]|nr:formate dehydrogenase subunit gamma [Burkholderiales bacterium]